jgi:DNA repair protein RecN (Recombination protein N)
MATDFYLKKLIIQNFATFKNQSINFKPGFNAIIGETGSGKSLVLDALQLILGSRADKKIVRRDTEYSLIEASFFCEDARVKIFLETEGFPVENNEIIVKRLIYKNGNSKNFINHLACTLNFLSSFSRKFIDLVGQFENQKLLSDHYQIHLLDNFANQTIETNQFQKKLSELKKLQKENEELLHSKTSRNQRLDYLNFQLEEIDKLKPTIEDEELLLKKKTILMSLEKTKKICSHAKSCLEGEDERPGILEQIKILNHLFLKNREIFPDIVDFIIEIEDKAQSLQSAIDNKINYEEDILELEKTIERIDSYQKLKKKFGGSVETILQTKIDFIKEKNFLESLDINLEGITSKIESIHVSLLALAKNLHQKRVEFGEKLAEELTKKVRNLKMTGASVKFVIEELNYLSDTGTSKINFMAETNPGEGYFKIKDIASGGELSRILLSLRQISSSQDSISIFLFDEIDTGIGGETAHCIGKALAEVALHGQVIAITHLPQIAQFAESLIIVHKDIEAKNHEARTESKIRVVCGQSINKEVKSMAQLYPSHLNLQSSNSSGQPS